MATGNIGADYDYYRPPGGNWDAYYNHSTAGYALFAGDNSAGSDFRVIVHFPMTTYTNASFTAATLNMTRFTADSSSAQTLSIQVVTTDALGANAGAYTVVSGSPTVPWNVSAGAGEKSVNILGLMPYLKAASDRCLMIYGGTSEYTEFRPTEYSSGSQKANIDVTYTYPMAVRVGGSWKNGIDRKIKVAGSWKTIVATKVKVGGTWKTIM